MDDFLVERVPASKKAAFARLFQRYLREHAPFTGKRPIDGVYQYPWLDLYWREQGARWPFWMRTIGDLAAFDEAPLPLDDGVARIETRFTV